MPKISINEDNCIELTEVYLPLILKTNDGEKMIITMRDSGFEFTYEGRLFHAKNGVLTIILTPEAQPQHECILEQKKPKTEQKTGNLAEQTSIEEIVERYGVHHFELLDNKNNTIAEFEKMDNGNYRIRYCRSEKELYQSLGSVINIIREEMKNGCSLQRINGRL